MLADMSESVAEFNEDPPRMAEDAVPDVDALLLNLDGYEGPIDVLLQLARDQKVDITKISILQLARQFLAFIERARDLRLDLAAEYLVMAAWLAYLKSRLLLPKPDINSDEPSANDMAEALAYQLRRLEAMQAAAQQLWKKPQRGLDFYGRGFVEPNESKTEVVWTADLYDLIKAYGDIRARKDKGKTYELPRFNLMSMEDALDRLSRMLGRLPKQGRHTVWTTLQSFMPEDADPLYRRSALSSVLTGALELAKQGQLEIRQDGLFRPVYLRGREADEKNEENVA
jgi:segregation and condensation protein A